MDAAAAEPRGGRDLADGQTGLVGLDDSPDPLLLGFFEPFGGEPQPVGELPFAADLLPELVVGLHHLRLSDAVAPVQQTGRQGVVFCAAADTVGEFPSRADWPEDGGYGAHRGSESAAPGAPTRIRRQYQHWTRKLE